MVIKDYLKTIDNLESLNKPDNFFLGYYNMDYLEGGNE